MLIVKNIEHKNMAVFRSVEISKAFQLLMGNYRVLMDLMNTQLN